jgi:L-amino acid N-acyltransferase YncA
LIIRSATYADIDALLAIFAHARKQMAADGNPTQWGDGYPEHEQLEEDIQRGVSYVMEHEGFTRCGIIYTRNHSSRVAYQRISTT